MGTPALSLPTFCAAERQPIIAQYFSTGTRKPTPLTTQSPVGTIETWRESVSRPYGTEHHGGSPSVPSDESLGYYQPSLRDENSGIVEIDGLNMWARRSCPSARLWRAGVPVLLGQRHL